MSGSRGHAGTGLSLWIGRKKVFIETRLRMLPRFNGRSRIPLWP